MISQEEIIQVGEKYGICVTTIGEKIDTSRGKEDQRLHYPLNNEYMLKVGNAPFLTETYLKGIAELIERYRRIDVYCPRLIRNEEECYLTKVKHENQEYCCYIEEYAHYKDADSVGVEGYELKKEMMWHLGRLALKYTNVDLVKTRSMWSIIELAPLDVDIDEKQENLNLLTECLREAGESRLADNIVKTNQKLRAKIKPHLKKLPSCVYQGDLNDRNVLVDGQKRFVGLLDFNLYGTEVNINCFLNETMYFLTEQDFEKLNASEILEKMNRTQEELIGPILQEYSLNELEKHCLPLYKKVIDLSFYPNAMLYIKLLKNKETKGKVVELLQQILKYDLRITQ